MFTETRGTAGEGEEGETVFTWGGGEGREVLNAQPSGVFIMLTLCLLMGCWKGEGDRERGGRIGGGGYTGMLGGE